MNFELTKEADERHKIRTIPKYLGYINDLSGHRGWWEMNEELIVEVL